MKFVATISFFLFACLSLAQSKKEVTLSIDPTDVEAGESFVITVESTVQGDLEIDNLPGSFTYGAGTSREMSQRMDHNTGEIINYFRISQVGIVSKPGTYTIGPAWVKSGNKSYKSNKTTITVGNQMPMNSGVVSSRQLNSPAFGVVQTNKTTVYEGEPVLVSAKVYSRFAPTDFTGYRSFLSNQSIESQSIGQMNRFRMKEERFKDINFYTFEYDKQVIFPIGAGPLRIDPFSMDILQGFDGYRVLSSGATLTIKPLPANPPQDFIGAVGEYTITRTLDTLVIHQGDIFRMLITIEGTGNLQNILEPTLQLPKGFVVYGDPVVSENISYSSKGAQGSMLYEYNIQTTRNGKIKLPGTAVSYFNPKTEKYVQITSEEHDLTVKTVSNYTAVNTTANEAEPQEINANLYTLRTKQNHASEDRFFGTPLFWSGVGGPILSAFIFLLFVKKRERDGEKIEKREMVRKKSKNIEDFLSIASNEIEGDKDAFFSAIETAMKTAFSIPLNASSPAHISKNDIQNYLASKGKEELFTHVNQLFKICQESRFAFGEGQYSRREAFNQLKYVLDQIK